MEAARRPHQVALIDAFQEKFGRRRKRSEVERVTVFTRGSWEGSDLQLAGAGDTVLGLGVFRTRDEEGCAFSHDEGVLRFVVLVAVYGIVVVCG